MSKKSLIIYIIICVAVAAIASFITFQVVTNQETETDDDHMTKFGITIKLNKDPNSINSTNTLYQNKDSFRVKVEALQNAPKPGETFTIDLGDATGTFDTNVRADCNATISFENDMFIENGVFNCPLKFILGRNSNGDQIIIDGQNYIGKKHEFMTAMQYAFDEQDREFIPKGTDINKLFNNEINLFKVEYPKDRAQKDENTTFKLDYNSIVEKVN